MKKILFDFDDTIINHKVWSPERNANLAKLLGIPTDEYIAFHESYKSELTRPQDFDLDILSDRAVLKYDVSKEDFQSIYFDSNTIKKAMFEDVIPTLNVLRERDYKLGIYSAGTYDFQYQRISRIGITNYIDDGLIFISLDKESDEYIEQLHECYIVDDNVMVIDALSKHNHITPIWLNRNNKVYEFESKINEISSLLQLLDLI